MRRAFIADEDKCVSMMDRAEQKSEKADAPMRMELCGVPFVPEVVNHYGDHQRNFKVDQVHKLRTPLAPMRQSAAYGDLMEAFLTVIVWGKNGFGRF